MKFTTLINDIQTPFNYELTQDMFYDSYTPLDESHILMPLKTDNPNYQMYLMTDNKTIVGFYQPLNEVWNFKKHSIPVDLTEYEKELIRVQYRKLIGEITEFLTVNEFVNDLRKHDEIFYSPMPVRANTLNVAFSQMMFNNITYTKRINAVTLSYKLGNGVYINTLTLYNSFEKAMRISEFNNVYNIENIEYVIKLKDTDETVVLKTSKRN